MMHRLCKRDALRALRAWARGAAPLHTLPSPPGGSGGRTSLRYACPLAGRLAAPVASRPSRYAVATRALTRLPQLMKPTTRHDSGYPIDGLADNRRWLIDGLSTGPMQFQG